MSARPGLKTYFKMNVLVRILAISLSIYQLNAAIFGPPEELIFRAAHLGFVLPILFLGVRRGKDALAKIKVFDVVLAVVGVLSIIYLLYDYSDVINRFAYVTPLKPLEIIFGIALTLIVLEGARRTAGLALPIIAVIFMSYAVFANYLPGILRHPGVSLIGLIEQMYLLPDGIFGSPLGVSAKYLVIFILFGAFLQQAGAGSFFTDFASSLIGRVRGGPAKVAVVSSALFGTISGAPVANVTVTGTFTIPAMIKIGLKPEVAGAVEAVASTGGALMPPVLGTTAFLIVEFTGTTYKDVITWALIPAILYYICVYFSVHFHMLNLNVGFLEEKIQPLKQVMKEQGLIFIPIGSILYLIIAGYTASFAAWVSIALIILVSWFRRSTRIGLKKAIMALEQGGRGIITVAMACACAGIIAGVILLTGLGMKLAGVLLTMSGGYQFILLVFAAVTLIILGMGMPAAPAYVISASLFAPTLIKAGIPVNAAHMFIFYYALLSAISPPVALAAFAASSISGASPMKTGFWAVRLAIVAYILPFTFAYSQELLMTGAPFTITLAFLTATIGVIALAYGVQGFILNWPFRVLLIIAGILMIIPGYRTDLIGLIIIGCVVGFLKFVRRNVVIPQRGQ